MRGERTAMLMGIEVVIAVVLTLIAVGFGFSLGRMTKGEKPLGVGLAEAIKAKDDPKDSVYQDPYFEAMQTDEKPKRIPTVED